MGVPKGYLIHHKQISRALKKDLATIIAIKASLFPIKDPRRSSSILFLSSFLIPRHNVHNPLSTSNSVE